MAEFHAIRDRAIRAVDAVMAETVRFYPLSGGRADATRPQGDMRCVLRVGRAKDQATGEGGRWSQRIAFGKAEAHVDRGQPTASDIRKGDKLRAIERPGALWFEVLVVNEREDGRLVLDLGEAG